MEEHGDNYLVLNEDDFEEMQLKNRWSSGPIIPGKFDGPGVYYVNGYYGRIIRIDVDELIVEAAASIENYVDEIESMRRLKRWVEFDLRKWQSWKERFDEVAQ